MVWFGCSMLDPRSLNRGYAWIDADKQGKVGRTKRSAAAAWSLLLSVKFV
jgi:hypothetical protein